jgi:hypothetical protein
MIDCLEKKICEAHCCASVWAADYVYRKTKGRVTEEDFIKLVMVNQYLDSLDRYKNSLSLGHSKCSSCNSTEDASCLTEAQAQFILDQITTICGSCSCNC